MMLGVWKGGLGLRFVGVDECGVQDDEDVYLSFWWSGQGKGGSLSVAKFCGFFGWVLVSHASTII